LLDKEAGEDVDNEAGGPIKLNNLVILAREAAARLCLTSVNILVKIEGKKSPTIARNVLVRSRCLDLTHTWPHRPASTPEK